MEKYCPLGFEYSLSVVGTTALTKIQSNLATYVFCNDTTLLKVNSSLSAKVNVGKAGWIPDMNFCGQVL